MKSMFALSLFVFLTNQASASMIHADLRCERPGGGLAIKMQTPTSPARVWQTDVGQPDGLELQVTKFEMQNCAQCFQFEGTLMGESIRGSVASGLLNYEMYSKDSKQWVSLLANVKCVTVRPIF